MKIGSFFSGLLHPSLQGRFLQTVTGRSLLLLVPMLLALGMLFLFGFNAVRYAHLTQRHIEDIHKIANSYAQALHYPLWSFDADNVSSLVRTLASVQDVTCVAVHDFALNKRWTSADCAGAQGNSLSIPIRHADSAIAELSLHYSFASMQERLDDEFLQGLLLVVGLLGMLLIGAILTQRILVGRPLSRLLSAIQVSKNYHDYREVKWPGTDEYGLIVDAFNDLIRGKQNSEQRIAHLALHDPLTDLPNRMLVLDRLAQLVNEAQRNQTLVAVLFIDLDDFKKVNDSLGHETGDRLLIEAAKRLSGSLRAEDTVGRLGGDEFVVLLGGIASQQHAQSVADTLLQQLGSAYRIDERELVLTASIGLAVFPDDGEDAQSLLRNADMAMYHAKREGRNTHSFFTPQMNRDANFRLALEEQLRGALDRGEFSLVYQPKYHLQTSRLSGAEALLRWQNPVLGDVRPDQFIPVAERSSLIVPIGNFVLREALAQTRIWQVGGMPDFHIALNLSPRQFRDPGQAKSIRSALETAGLDPSCLELEITEGVLMGGDPLTGRTLEAISAMQVGIVMDDFGTGYSSLSYLRAYPFNALKIDKSFIEDVCDDPGDRELILATIVMAHGLGLKVVAEGVENCQQLAALGEMNCDYAQGVLFSRPLSGQAMTDLLKQEIGKRVSA